MLIDYHFGISSLTLDAYTEDPLEAKALSDVLEFSNGRFRKIDKKFVRDDLGRDRISYLIEGKRNIELFLNAVGGVKKGVLINFDEEQLGPKYHCSELCSQGSRGTCA